MRYDKPIYFQRLRQSSYDNETGDYIENDPVETMRMADVTDTSAITMQTVYGNITQKSLTIRLNWYYNAPFDFIRIADKRYKVDRQRLLQHKQVFIVSEV